MRRSIERSPNEADTNRGRPAIFPEKGAPQDASLDSVCLWRPRQDGGSRDGRVPSLPFSRIRITRPLDDHSATTLSRQPWSPVASCPCEGPLSGVFYSLLFKLSLFALSPGSGISGRERGVWRMAMFTRPLGWCEAQRKTLSYHVCSVAGPSPLCYSLYFLSRFFLFLLRSYENRSSA